MPVINEVHNDRIAFVYRKFGTAQDDYVLNAFRARDAARKGCAERPTATGVQMAGSGPRDNRGVSQPNTSRTRA